MRIDAKWEMICTVHFNYSDRFTSYEESIRVQYRCIPQFYSVNAFSENVYVNAKVCELF